MKAMIRALGLPSLFKEVELEPTLILIMSAVLLSIHRLFGSIEFARRMFVGWSGIEASLYMFVSAFVLLGVVPFLIVVFLFKGHPADYGLRIGNWKFGLTLSLGLILPIGIALLYPASQTPEMRGFYPFASEAMDSPLGFLLLELPRGIFFYTAWEFFFRGFMLFGLRRYVGDWLAICIQVIPQCLWHIGMPAGELLSSIAGGFLFGIMALRTKSILWPLLLHYLIGVGLDLLIIVTS